MSMICRMVLGWIELTPELLSCVVVKQPLDAATVGRLQAACDDILGVGLRLADFFDEPNYIDFKGPFITDEMSRIAIVAHELFGMTAVDAAHRYAEYPRPNEELQTLDEWMQNYRDRPWLDWDEAKIRELAEFSHRHQLERAAFERDVVQRVLAHQTRRRPEPGAAAEGIRRPSPGDA